MDKTERIYPNLYSEAQRPRTTHLGNIIRNIRLAYSGTSSTVAFAEECLKNPKLQNLLSRVESGAVIVPGDSLMTPLLAFIESTSPYSQFVRELYYGYKDSIFLRHDHDWFYTHLYLMVADKTSATHAHFCNDSVFTKSAPLQDLIKLVTCYKPRDPHAQFLGIHKKIPSQCVVATCESTHRSVIFFGKVVAFEVGIEGMNVPKLISHHGYIQNLYSTFIDRYEAPTKIGDKLGAEVNALRKRLFGKEEK